mmetsp:Transcript_11107/g.35066  ORF Transcript_11107/g.35066 Transcript_11107/m.35066 type:complete len:239 (-) Transcript_11107:92-808(-)
MPPPPLTPLTAPPPRLPPPFLVGGVRPPRGEVRLLAPPRGEARPLPRAPLRPRAPGAREEARDVGGACKGHRAVRAASGGECASSPRKRCTPGAASGCAACTFRTPTCPERAVAAPALRRRLRRREPREAGPVWCSLPQPPAPPPSARTTRSNCDLATASLARPSPRNPPRRRRRLRQDWRREPTSSAPRLAARRSLLAAPPTAAVARVASPHPPCRGRVALRRSCSLPRRAPQPRER